MTLSEKYEIKPNRGFGAKLLELPYCSYNNFASSPQNGLKWHIY